MRVTIYDKQGDCEAPWAQVIRRENVGREAETYVHHLLDRWDDLPELTVFAQGHPFDHASDFHAVLRALASGERVVADFAWFGFLVDSDDPRGRRLFVPWSKNPERKELAVDTFHRALLDAEPPEWLRFHGGAQFAVTRDRIRARGRAFWERALTLAREFPDAAHCFERTWDRIFGVQGVDTATLEDGFSAYLKPIKRRQIPPQEHLDV